MTPLPKTPDPGRHQYGPAVPSWVGVLAAAIIVIAVVGLIVWNGNQPRPYPRYVAGGQAGGDIQWLVTVPCSHKPTGWQDARSACDWDAIAAVIVTPEVYAAKNQGDPFP